MRLTKTPSGRLGWAFVVLSVVIAVYLHQVIIHPSMVMSSPHSDYTGFLLPRTAFVVNNVLKTGTLPLWRPVELGGVPTLGNPQVGVFYPPNIIVLLLGPLNSLGARFIFCLLFGGLFTFAYCTEIRMGFISSLFASLAFVLSGFIGTNIYAGHLQHISAIVWLPVCLFFVERIARRRRLIDAVGLSVCFAFQFMAGHPQYFFYSFIATVFYVVCLWLLHRKVATLLLFAFASAFSIVLAAVQLFPTVEFTACMTRGQEGYEFASGGSLSPLALCTFLMPNLLGKLADGTYWGPGFYWEQCGYLGVSTVVLAVTGALLSGRRRARILLFLALLSLLFALGRNLPFYYLLCKLVPPLMRFRVPSRMLFVYTFSTAVLAGLGMEYFILKDRAGKFFVWLVVAFFVITTGTVFFHLFPSLFIALGQSLVRFKFGLDAEGAHTMSLAEWVARVPVLYSRIREGATLWPTAVVLGLLGGVMLVYKRPFLTPSLFAVSVMAIMCVEMLIFDMPLIRVSDQRYYYPRTEAIDRLAADGDFFRIMDFSGRLGLERVEPYGIQTAHNFESGFIRWYADLLTLVRFRIGNMNPESDDLGRLNMDFNPDVLRLSPKDTPLKLINCTTRYRITDLDSVQNGLNLLNVKYIALNNPIDDENFELAYYDGDVYLYRNTRVLPRAFLVYNMEVIPDRMAAFSRMAAFDPRITVIVPEGGEPEGGEGNFTPVEILSYEPDCIRCEVNVQKPCYLILSEIWYPGWEAYVNGERRDVFLANYAFRGVALEPGRHEIEFRYNPLSYLLGRIVSLAGLAVAIAIIIVGRKYHD